MTGLFTIAVEIGSLGALLLSAHGLLNAILVRRPNVVVKQGSPQGVAGSAAGVTVCIPARDEARNVDACLKAVLANHGVTDLRVLLLDDGSTDETRSIASMVAVSDARLEVVEGGGEPLPIGWMGKPWACERLLARVDTPIVVFVDADVRLGPNALVAGVSMLRAHRLSLVSPYPKQLVGSWSERLTQPLLQWLWMTFLPLRLAERAKPVSMAAANGQFMILDTEALRSVGGFQSVAQEVLDDVALARSFKRSGYRAIVADGSTLATCRMYEGWVALREGYTKNLWSATGSPFGAAAMAVMFSGLYLLPAAGLVVGIVQRNGPLVLVGGLGYLSGVMGRVTTARITGGSRRDALAHPASIAILLWLIARSWRQHLRGAITWKGRPL